MDFMFKHCPYDTHSKMYPGGLEKAVKGKTVFGLIQNIILTLGLLLLVSLSYVMFSGEISLKHLGFVPLVFGMLQGLSFFLLEISGFKQLKHMRQLNQLSERTAELSPRNVFNFITPLQLLLTISANLLCIYLTLRFNEYQLTADIIVIIGSLCLSNLMFIVVGYSMVHGKKLDPYQSAKDRHNNIQASLHAFISVSILISLYLTINEAVNHYSLDKWEPVFNSMYWILIMSLGLGATLKHLDIKEINFDVYKGTPAVK